MRSFSLSQKGEGYDQNNIPVYNCINRYQWLFKEALEKGIPRNIDRSLHNAKKGERGYDLERSFRRALEATLNTYGKGKSEGLKEGKPLTPTQKRIIERALKEAEAYNNAGHRRHS